MRIGLLIFIADLHNLLFQLLRQPAPTTAMANSIDTLAGPGVTVGSSKLQDYWGKLAVFRENAAAQLCLPNPNF
jgi:hypothetical protein